MTFRSLLLHGPDFNPNDEPKLEPGPPPPIQFRHIALLLVGSLVGGSLVGFLAGEAAREFTHSKFALALVFGASLYGSFLVGYHWISKEQDWIGLRARFSPVSRKVLLLSALGAFGILALIVSAAALLHWAGVKISHVENPAILPTRWAEMPMALLFICVLVPLTEELLFRGLLLDWLRQKVNVWIAAVTLSVLFSLLHFNPFASGAIGWLAFSDRFLVGLAASALAINYHSLRPSFVIHATLNGIACIASVFDGA